MGIVLTVLAVVFLLVGVAAAGMAARLSSAGDAPAVAERQRRLRFRLATPAFLLGVLLFVASRFV
ncbi:hypothetical protein NF556_16970 [Ornithinimicrobium faecis]|uniref:Uncharacterized protein n=1 Tax=Ornithinimicrobium faecis TaxID=2934158 RepID=A0ABY4YRA7_9MICO|nr:hypothetical protein [Ornithinimicrobium sp. HY1793]USQ79282.1 hypothetical protein NF556_16970 [Ornithinimicrobium sp. HY1793]